VGNGIDIGIKFGKCYTDVFGFAFRFHTMVREVYRYLCRVLRGHADEVCSDIEVSR